MSDRVLLATFEHEDDLLSAVSAVRERGLTIRDVYSPYAVHGLDRAMGLKPSRLTWICFVCGMLGAVGMLWFEHWSASTNWPLDVGGKPWNSLPSDIPVAFEAAVLLAGFGSVFALLVACRLYPGKRVSPMNRRITDDQFVMVVDDLDAAFNSDAVSQLLSSFHAVAIEERLTDGKDRR